MRKISMALIVLIFASLTSCVDDTPIHMPAPIADPTPEEIITANCALVKQAADSFAAENDGEYAVMITDTSLAGHTLIDLLPGGELLLNPYTDLETEPRNWTGDHEKGEVIYMGVICSGFTAGYHIMSYNDEGDFLIHLSPYSEEHFDEELSVACTCFALEYAAKRFAEENEGVYPLNVDADENQAGRTVMYYLVNPRENPFTELLTEPRNGTASSPGEIGYIPVTANGIPVGYRITGYGAENVIKILSDVPEVEF